MDRRTLLTRVAALASIAAPTPCLRAAPSRSPRRVEVLLYDSQEAWDWFVAQLRTELSLLGWTEGNNFRVHWNYADGSVTRLRALATQIAASAPDVILTRGTPATRALQNATKTIPIVTGLGDPIGAGFAMSYAEPGGNVTGITYAIAEASDKYFELLQQLVPGLMDVVVVWRTDRASSLDELMRPIQASARKTKVTVRSALVGTASELREALRADRTHGPSAAIIFTPGGTNTYEETGRTALDARMPTMFEYREYVDAGGLASFRYNWENQTRRTAAQIDKLLRGEKPGQIPFEFPTRQEFVLNMKTARALGLAVPQSLALRADVLIE
jgi:putative tryptophan/tyrosine transport system substrate-binding protein